MSDEFRVPVYENVDWQEKVIARVKYNQNLDFWDGHNMSNGSTGTHLGLTKLKDGRYVLIHGTDWQGQRSYGEIITKERAFQAIIRSGNNDLLKAKKFEELNEFLKNMPQEEEE
jgi:hypothetical protein